MNRSPAPSAGRFAGGLAVLAGAAVLLRALHLWNQAHALPFLGQPILDAAVYRDWAAALASGRGFVTGPYYQAPGYPQFLSLVFRVFGPSAVAAAAVQSLLGAATVVLAALLGRRLFGPREGLLAGALLLLYGPLYVFEAKLLPTSLAVFLALSAVLLAVLAEAAARRLPDGAPPPRPRWRAPALFALAGLAAGVLGTVRPNLLVLPLVLIGVYAVRAARGRLPLRAPAVYAGAVLFALLPVFAHNALHGAFTPVATSGGINFYLGNHRGAHGVYDEIPGVSGNIRHQEAQADSVAGALAGRPLGPAAASRFWFRRAVAEVGGDPLGWVKLEGTKLLLLLGRQEETVNGSVPVERSRVALLRVLVLPFNLLAGLGLLGLGAARRRRGGGGDSRAPAEALLLAVLVTGLAFFALARLRLPAVPVLAVFAGYALVRAFEALRARRWKAPAAGLLALGAFTAATWVSPAGPNRNPRWEGKLFVQVGEMLQADGEADRAVAAYREAIAYDPVNLEARIRLASLEAVRGEVPSAIRRLEEALPLAPADAALRSNLGILYYVAGRGADCVRVMTEASALDSTLAAPRLYRGLVRARTGAPGAEADLRAALARDPGLPSAYAALIDLLARSGRMEEARSWADRASQQGIGLPPGTRERLR